MRLRISTSDPSVSIFTICLGQDARCPGLDLDGDRRLLADIVEARLPAIVAAKIEIFQAGVADGEIVQADRLPLERPEVLLEKREIVRQRLVAVDVTARPALERPGREAPDIGADIEDHRPRGPIGHLVFPAQNLLDVAAHGLWTFDVHDARRHLTERRELSP
jgi:hypothetical protein